MASGDSEFTLAEWEAIVRHRAESYEERKREYIRWTAAGLVAIAAVSGLVLQRIAALNLGAAPYPGLIILFVAGYLINEASWQLTWEKVTQAVTTIMGGRVPRVWDLISEPADAARKPAASIALEFAWPVGITIILIGAVLEFPSSGSRWIWALAGLRTVILALFIPFIVWYRRSDRTLPTGQGLRIRALVFGKIVMASYYGPQIFLVAAAYLSLSAASLDAVVLVLAVAAILGVGRWIWRITWSLVKHNAGLMGVFLRVHNAILSGEYSSAAKVAAEVKRLYLGETSSRPRPPSP